MAMTEGSGEENVLDGVFDRETPQETVVDTESTEAARARDEKGRFAPKVQPEADTTQAQPEPVPIEQAAPPDPNANRQVPLSELMAERKKRQEIERLHIEAEARAKAYEQMQSQQRPTPQPQAQPQQQRPDPYTDPEGWAEYVENQAQQKMFATRAALSKRMTVREYGAEAVEAALRSAPVDLCNHLWATSDDPFGDLMEWNKQQMVQKEVGTDLEAYRKKIEEETRQKVLAELKAGGASGQPQPKFPGSLAAATQTGEQGGMLTVEAAMGDIFSSGRSRKHG